MSQRSRSAPLGATVEQAYGGYVGHRLVRGLVNWCRYRDTVIGDCPTEVLRKLRRSLKQSQAKSAQALLDWWNSAYHDISFMHDSRKAFFKSAMRILQGEHGWIHYDPRGTENMYHYQMYTLWIHEFMVHDEDINDKFLSYLLQVRRVGVKIAVCQRLAQSCCGVLVKASIKQVLGESNPDFYDPPSVRYLLSGVVNISPSVDPCPWLTPEESSPFYLDSTVRLPYYLWDRELKRTVKTNSLRDPPVYSAISHTWGRWRTPAPPIHLDGVPWPIPQNSRFDVGKLPTLMASAEFKQRYIWIDLLCIPQESTEESLCAIRDIEIGYQAEIFQGSYRSYAWLNNVNSWQGLRNTCIWIALKYFTGSGSGNRWTEGIIRQVSEHANKSTQLVAPWDYASRPAPHELEPTGWFTSLWTLQEVCIRPDMVLLNSEMEPFSVANSWIVPFDSIVALVNGYHNSIGWQKGYAPEHMAPDLPPMFDRRFLYEAFKMLPEENEIAEHDTEESFRTYTKGAAHTWRWKKGHVPRGELVVDPTRDIDAELISDGNPLMPKGPSELICLLRLTGLDEILSMTRLHILWNANSRYCERNRAEAIMSVVGAANWYHERLKTGRPQISKDDDMILGKYPLPFLEEAISKLGASFFSTNPRFFDLMVPLAIIQHDDGVLQEVRVVHGKGTLLPIVTDRRNLVFQRVFDALYGAESHPSLKTWRLSMDGSFHMREVGIIATSADNCRNNDGQEDVILAHLEAPLPSGGISPGVSSGQLDVDLRQYLRTFMPKEFKVAICLYGSPEGSFGVILLERGPLGVPGVEVGPAQKREFVKVGLFWTRKACPMPTSQVVNWRVL